MGNRSLGMDEAITRRDFLNASLLGVGGSLMWVPAPIHSMAGVDRRQDESWYGYGGVGDYANSHGNTPEVVRVAHGIQDGQCNPLPTATVDTGEVFDLVVVGAGMAGLGAAYEFKKVMKPGHTCLILENHPVFGGESKRNEFIVNGQRLIGPQGSNGFSIPDLGAVEDDYAAGDARYYSELGVPRDFTYRRWDSSRTPMKFGRDNYGCMFWLEDTVSVGYFYDQPTQGTDLLCVRDPWSNEFDGAPLPTRVRENLLAWRDSSDKHYAGDDVRQWLDTMTYKDYVEKVMRLDPAVTAHIDPAVAAAVGLGCDAISAYAAFAILLPGVRAYADNELIGKRHSFPGGNDGFARYFVKTIIPGAIAGSDSFEDILNGSVNFAALDEASSPVRMRLGSTVVHVEHDGPPAQSEHVWVTYARGDGVYRVRARSVVMASGGWVNRHVVRDLPDEYRVAYGDFHHAPFLVVNVALTNWRFLHRLGITACRWSGGFGFSCNIREPMMVGDYQPPLDPDQPTILSFYVPYYYPGLSIRDQGARGRRELLGTSFADYERQIRQQMIRLFSAAGFDPRRDIAGIILNRWGHAYVVPQPGFYFGRNGRPAPRDIIRTRFGRIAFGHSELRGNQHWGPAADEGRRAVQQIMEVL